MWGGSHPPSLYKPHRSPKDLAVPSPALFRTDKATGQGRETELKFTVSALGALRWAQILLISLPQPSSLCDLVERCTLWCISDISWRCGENDYLGEYCRHFLCVRYSWEPV